MKSTTVLLAFLLALPTSQSWGEQDAPPPPDTAPNPKPTSQETPPKGTPQQTPPAVQPVSPGTSVAPQEATKPQAPQQQTITLPQQQFTIQYQPASIQVVQAPAPANCTPPQQTLAPQQCYSQAYQPVPAAAYQPVYAAPVQAVTPVLLMQQPSLCGRLAGATGRALLTTGQTLSAVGSVLATRGQPTVSTAGSVQAALMPVAQAAPMYQTLQTIQPAPTCGVPMQGLTQAVVPAAFAPLQALQALPLQSVAPQQPQAAYAPQPTPQAIPSPQTPLKSHWRK